jgi:hypothetical protein
MKTEQVRPYEAVEAYRKKLYYYYDEKYFNLFIQSWKWTGLSKEQSEYIMRRFWSDGRVAAFSLINSSESFLGGQTPSQAKEMAISNNALLGLAPYAVIGYNMLNFPIACTLINQRGVPFIPARTMVNHKDVVFGYAQHSLQPIKGIVDIAVEQIVDAKMTMRTNLIAQKMPVVVEVDSKNPQHAECLQKQAINDNTYFFVNVRETDSIKAVNTGVPYIVDKLQAYVDKLDNEVLTFLGIDNMGSLQDKKEREGMDEVNSNNNIINDFSDSIKSNFDEFCKEVKEVLHFDISVEAMNSPAQAVQEETDEEPTNEERKDGQNNGTGL